MYWYKDDKTIITIAALAIVGAAFFGSCQSSEQKHMRETQVYTDLPAYFQKEITRLTQENPTILKTVVKDSLSETKEITLKNWGRELTSFTSVDLNKPAYQGLFDKDSANNIVTYVSNSPKIDLERVEISYNQEGKPTSFLIKRAIKNSLYETKEIFSYESAKGYSIEKKQSILLLGDKYYFIKGEFKP